MIVSVSRRSDIPAFFADWFGAAWQQGYADVVNPYNPTLSRRVSLHASDVDALVFWTRQPAPMLPMLDELSKAGMPFYFLLTVTNYPRRLEPHTPPLAQLLPAIQALAARFGRERIVWRYDPIIVAPGMDTAFQHSNFAYLAAALAPYCCRVIVSFLDLYRKTASRLAKAGIVPVPVESLPGQFDTLLGPLSASARKCGLDMQACAEEVDLSRFGIARGKCIDEELLNRLFNLQLVYKKDPNQRSACLCQQSVDIGQYRTCRHGCMYCYAC